MFAYDNTFDPKVVPGHCDLILRFSDFALYLGTQLVNDYIVFHRMFVYDKTFDPKVVVGRCDLIHGSVILPRILTLSWYIFILLSDYE